MNGKRPTRYVIDVTWTADMGYDATLADAPVSRLVSLAMATGQLDTFESFGEGLVERATARGLVVPFGGAIEAPVDWRDEQDWNEDDTAPLKFEQYDIEARNVKTGDRILVTTRLCLWGQKGRRWLTGMDPAVAADFWSEPGDPSDAQPVELPAGRHLWCKIRDVRSCVHERPDSFGDMVAH